MRPPHPKYKIRQGDTLESITALFGVDESVWTQYHSNMCRLDDIIVDSLPKHLTEIFLLPELWEKEDDLNHVVPEAARNSRQPIVLHMENVLFYAPMNLNNRYGVVFQFQKDKVHFEIECAYKEKVADGVYQIAFNREQVYVNEQTPDLTLYEIADQMAKAIYPLLFNINRERKIEEVCNFSEIVQRCEEVRKKLSEYYVGEYAEKYINQFEKQCNNPNNLINHIENELFYQLLFLPIQGLYENLQKTVQHQFAFGKSGEIICDLDITIEPEYTESGKLTARIVGKEKQSGEFCFQAEYRLYPEDNSVFSIQGYLMDVQSKQKANFEVYHLNPKQRSFRNIIPKYKALYLTETKEVPVKKKRSFWDMFI